MPLRILPTVRIWPAGWILPARRILPPIGVLAAGRHLRCRQLLDQQDAQKREWNSTFHVRLLDAIRKWNGYV